MENLKKDKSEKEQAGRRTALKRKNRKNTILESKTPNNVNSEEEQQMKNDKSEKDTSDKEESEKGKF